MTQARNLSQLADGVSVAGVLDIAHGGTNSTSTPTAGGVGYGTGTAIAITPVGTAGQVLTSDGAGVPIWATPTAGGGGGSSAYTKQFNLVGSVNVGAGTLRWYPDTGIIITSIFSSVGIAPSAGSLVMNVKKSGVTIATTTLTAGQNRSTPVAVNATILTTEYITVDVVSSNASADATLTFSYTRA